MFGLRSFRTGTSFALPYAGNGGIAGHILLMLVIDFSPVITILHIISSFFTPFLNRKGLVSRRLQEIPGDKRHRGQKTKCENNKWLGFIGKTRSHEIGGSEIFHANEARLSRVVPAGPALSQVRFFAGGACTQCEDGARLGAWGAEVRIGDKKSVEGSQTAAGCPSQAWKWLVRTLPVARGWAVIS